MNETIAIVIWFVAVIALIAIVVRWWFKSEPDNIYTKSKDRIFDDFYSLGMGKK